MKMRINEIKKLYHGTDKKFKTFDFEKAGKAKDFGRGFYLMSSRPKTCIVWQKN